MAYSSSSSNALSKEAEDAVRKWSGMEDEEEDKKKRGKFGFSFSSLRTSSRRSSRKNIAQSPGVFESSPSTRRRSRRGSKDRARISEPEISSTGSLTDASTIVQARKTVEMRHQIAEKEKRLRVLKEQNSSALMNIQHCVKKAAQAKRSCNEKSREMEILQKNLAEAELECASLLEDNVDCLMWVKMFQDAIKYREDALASLCMSVRYGPEGTNKSELVLPQMPTSLQVSPRTARGTKFRPAEAAPDEETHGALQVPSESPAVAPNSVLKASHQVLSQYSPRTIVDVSEEGDDSDEEEEEEEEEQEEREVDLDDFSDRARVVDISDDEEESSTETEE